MCWDRIRPPILWPPHGPRGWGLKSLQAIRRSPEFHRNPRATRSSLRFPGSQPPTRSAPDLPSATPRQCKMGRTQRGVGAREQNKRPHQAQAGSVTSVWRAACTAASFQPKKGTCSTSLESAMRARMSNRTLGITPATLTMVDCGFGQASQSDTRRSTRQSPPLQTPVRRRGSDFRIQQCLNGTKIIEVAR